MKMLGRDGSRWWHDPHTNRVTQTHAPGGVEIPEPAEPRPRKPSPAAQRAAVVRAHVAQIEKPPKPARAAKARDTSTGELFK